MRTAVIGDVHGCLEELDELLARLAPRASDRLVFVGDLMDRGPDPVGVVRRVRALGAECVFGNHEDKHVRWASHEAKRRARPNYRNPMKSMGPSDAAANAALTHEEVAWLASLPSWLDLGDGWLAVHAGFEPEVGLEAQRRAVVARVRWVDARGRMKGGDDPTVQPPDTTLWSEAWPGPQSVVYGHHVLSLERPRVDRPAPGVECWGIDTGCCFGGRLTALVLPERRVVQVEARAAYAVLRAPAPGGSSCEA
jgi:bis(5'-nucleosyl)-tetraphosphatase (symmetrical)